MKILTWCVWLFWPACTPSGRVKRIEHLMETTGEIKEVCAAIVYARDAKRVPFTFSNAEREEAKNLIALLESGHIRMPADRRKP